MPQQHSFLNHCNSLPKPLVGISACLCGDNVRYDGHAKGHPALIAALNPYLNLQKICPEVAIGMGTPRDPIQLSKESGEIRAIGINHPDYDVTPMLKRYARALLPVSLITTPESMPLCGYIFKSRSPSCGLGSTPIHENNIATDFGDGIFAKQIQQQRPWLPVAEEQSLTNSAQQQHFVMLAQLTALFLKSLESKELQTFQNKTEELRAQLPQIIQNQLIELTSSNEPMHYLTLLIKELQQTAYTDIKSML